MTSQELEDMRQKFARQVAEEQTNVAPRYLDLEETDELLNRSAPSPDPVIAQARVSGLAFRVIVVASVWWTLTMALGIRDEVHWVAALFR